MTKKLFLPAATLLVLASCSSDEILQESHNGGEPIMHFNGLVSNNTRAEVNLGVLESNGFHIDAYGNNDFYFQETATKKEDGDFWPENNYYWPGYKLDFVAWYDDMSIKTLSREYDTEGKVKFGYSYSVGKTDLTRTDPLDFVYATASATHNSSYTKSQDLNFNHIYSQILVTASAAQSGSDACDYTVIVNGVYLRYVPGQGDFKIGYGDNGTDIVSGWRLNNRKEITDYTQQDKDGNTIKLDDNTIVKGNCFTTYKYPSDLNLKKTLTATPQNINGNNTNGTLTDGFFLIPQEFTTTYTENYSQAWDGEKNTETVKHYGAYLALNVEIIKDGKTIRKGNIAVPVFKTITNLEAGKRYIINITFTKNGAGQVPPDDPEEGEEGGEPILGLPIHFTVTETGWSDITNNVTWTAPENNVEE